MGKSYVTTSYFNEDRRGVADNGSFLVTGSGNDLAVNIQALDAEIANAAFNFATSASAINGEGFSQLLGLTDVLQRRNSAEFGNVLDFAKSLFDRGESMIGQTQQAVLDAYSGAAADATRTIDNRTIIVLAIAAAVAVVAWRAAK